MDIGAKGAQPETGDEPNQRVHHTWLEDLSSGISIADADDALQPGAIFCLRAVGDAALAKVVVVNHSQANPVLDRLKGLCLGRDLVDAQACERFDQATKAGW